MGSGNVHHLDARIGAKSFNVAVDAAAEFGGEASRGLAPRIGRSDQLEARIRGERRKHQRKSPPKPGDTHSQAALSHRPFLEILLDRAVPGPTGRHTPL